MSTINIGGLKVDPTTLQKGYLPIHGDCIFGDLVIPKVTLTVEEAEKLMELLDTCSVLLTNIRVGSKCDDWASILEERIEEVESLK